MKKIGSRRLALGVLAATSALMISSCTAPGPAPDGGTSEPPSSAAAPTEAPALSWGPEQDHYDAAAAAVEAMSLEERAGQVMVSFYSGTDPAPQLAAIEELHLGGSIIMGDNVPLTADGKVDVAAMAQINKSLQDAMFNARDWPGIISVDQEGGMVARLGAPLTQWPTPMTYGAAADEAVSRDSMAAMATELAALGFTMDHAPGLDLTIGPADPTIGARSLGSDPERASAQTPALLEGFEKVGVMPSVKHFPGHGSVTTDSHLALPVQDASVAELQARDWKPFKAAIDAGAPVMMMGHIAVPALEPDVPSSLSAPSYQALRDLGFDGVVITDALNMGAVENQYPGGQAAPMALAAGADLLLMPADPYAAHAAILAAVEDGTLTEERLDEAATRVVTMQLWQKSIAQTPSLADIGTHAQDSQDASAAALTVLTGQCSREDQLDGSLTIQGADPAANGRLADAAEARGLTVGSGPTVTLLAGPESGSGDIVVSLDAPWGLELSSADVKAALYGDSPGAFEALLDYLTGEAGAPGTLPVDVGEYETGTGCG